MVCQQLATSLQKIYFRPTIFSNGNTIRSTPQPQVANTLCAIRYDTNCKPGVILAVIVCWLDLQLPMQSVHITTDVVSSNLDQGEVYYIM